MMEEIDFAEWVKRSENSANAAFRQAVHTLMLAISRADSLQARMIFHGGLLLAIRFQGIRHTKDIDFVTEDTASRVKVSGSALLPPRATRRNSLQKPFHVIYPRPLKISATRHNRRQSLI
jgi:hypothetical protein